MSPGLGEAGEQPAPAVTGSCPQQGQTAWCSELGLHSLFSPETDLETRRTGRQEVLAQLRLLPAFANPALQVACWGLTRNTDTCTKTGERLASFWLQVRSEKTSLL